MSFSKAKIQRFNDVKADCTPSPARYNVSIQEKAKLGIISKPSNHPKKPGSPQASEASSVHSTPCFQTPTLPVKKKKLLGMTFHSASRNTDAEELREKIVECNNKDLYIKDLIERIEEMTSTNSSLQKENDRLRGETRQSDRELQALKEQNVEDKVQRTKEYNGIMNNLKDVNKELKGIRRKYQDLKDENIVALSKLLGYFGQFEELYNGMLEENKQKIESLKKKHSEDMNNIENKLQQCCEEKEEIRLNYLEKLENLKKFHNEEQCRLENKLQEDIERLMKQHHKEREELEKTINERDAKIVLLEENFKDVRVLTELQMKQKIEEIEDLWKQKLADKERESNAILKECQEISEYNIIQCEIEKNQITKELEEKIKSNEETVKKCETLEEEMNKLKIEKHAYEVSITTFRDTIEVLKKRLISSDRDVVQLKEELEKCEEKILNYERKCIELSSQLDESQMANEELEMQYESTSKLMQNQVKETEKKLVAKVEMLKQEMEHLLKNRDFLHDVLAQYHEQQVLMGKAQSAIAESTSQIESMEKKHVELESELKQCKEDAEEAAEMRKKYQEKIRDLEEQLEVLRNELTAITTEAKEVSLKYAELLGHQNHLQKIKYVKDLKMKSSELLERNIDLESKNYKLNKMVDKLMKENEDLRKSSKKMKAGNDNKENPTIPKCITGTQSPGPLKDKN